MTTAKDLFIIAMEPRPEHTVGQGDLSLALAGAELVDLIGAGAITVDDDRIVPGEPSAPQDRLLGEAAARLTRQPPHEPVEEWLWRRGKDLSAAYRAALEEDGELTRKRSGRLSFGPERVEPADTPARRAAAARWEEREPVLASLVSAVGVGGGPSDDDPGPDDEAVTAVLTAVHDAVMELEAVRQRRTIENSAFANLWRGP
ncbi:GPP34 family phosphoprotein [Streptomyces microflavus]|uniref:GPP34 family phosphoprotein n=1 Tax=Streptomyces microflavus TaxID=1919 RepID=A0A7H8MVM6_STRMI|nr:MULTISPECIES: GPP34 family phosphoprotein [Streptomyces]MBK3585616.1 GPP34 family phosphoprotein [Streptomyces sp. MBT57]MBK5990079.1 GPP34 family phosphoprotein [Streptomyces sp. MBT58]QKW46233.1 GPP34 family phosphoprotein [Streptomyces microflavus]QTA35596.1 Golgi phosphoprotein 3 (GPP34) [Streptomyces sp. CA-256286]